MPGHDLLHEWLLETARKLPAAPAIIEEDRITTFAELSANAFAMSQTLSARGLRNGDRVAIVARKDTDSITALFATLMAGGVYVPIDPSWPRQRIDATLEDCAPLFVFTGKELTEAAPGPTTVDAALILFTSGSTGRPKGVVISHGAVAAFVKWCGGEFNIQSSDRIACPSPLNFDLSTFDIFSMALHGAACVIVSDQIAWMPRFLARFIAGERISAWYSVPSILSRMLNETTFNGVHCPNLRVILSAGEVLASRDAARLVQAFPTAACYNLYGPTETNVVTYYRLPRDVDGSLPVPIGKPCPYAEVELDPDAGGELLAGGESLMLGYYPAASGRPRLYRTGDRASVDADGNYQFIGRLDRQVKRRGYRLELGEIEAALSTHPRVLECAAIATPDDRRGVIVTAFVRAGDTVPEAALLAHCAKILPEYMLPDRIVAIEKMPRGNRGKIDYAGLRNAHDGNNS